MKEAYSHPEHQTKDFGWSSQDGLSVSRRNKEVCLSQQCISNSKLRAWNKSKYKIPSICQRKLVGTG